MDSQPSHGGDGPDWLDTLLMAALAAGTSFVLFALFLAHGWADLVVVLTALAVPAAAYALRRDVQRRTPYSTALSVPADTGDPRSRCTIQQQDWRS
jgi:hypothetical protein